MNKQLSLAPRNDYEECLKLLESMAADTEQFYHKNNQEAGTRLTVAIRKLELKLKESRHAVYRLKKTRKTTVLHGGPFDHEWGKN